MAAVHSKNTVVQVASNDLSSFCNASELTREADTHDVTGYGKDDKVYIPGLKDGTFTLGGHYNSDAAGPRAILQPLIGTEVAVIRQMEGTGAGLPQDSFNAIVTNYVETAPIASESQWTAEMQLTGPVDSTAQSA